jgi:hypothetical protein
MDRWWRVAPFQGWVSFLLGDSGRCPGLAPCAPLALGGAGGERRGGLGRWGAISEGYAASLQDAGDLFWGYLGCYPRLVCDARFGAFWGQLGWGSGGWGE